MSKSILSLSLAGLVSAIALSGCGGGDSQPSNQAPAISGLASVTVVDEDTPAALSFTINDAETSPANLVVTATSSDTTIVPPANIVLGGAGANRTVTVTPLADLVGATTIIVTVKDADGLSATASGVVSFREVRVDFPTYSRQAFQVSEGGTPLTVTREKFTFSGDGDLGFTVYSDLIGP